MMKLFSLKSSSVLPNKTVQYNHLLSSLFSNGNAKQAFKLFYQMLSDKLANNATWAIVVKESFTYREFEGCLALFKQYKAIATSTKEPIVYNFFLQGCFKKDKLDHAAHCYDEMKQSVKLNTITYSIMINGYLQKGELAKAECITAELVVNLAATPPIVDNLFLQYYLGVGDLEKAMDYFKKLKDLGSCDEFTYSALIKFMVQRDNINEGGLIYILLNLKTLTLSIQLELT
jgi:pentatricopeptide repeat protein